MELAEGQAVFPALRVAAWPAPCAQRQAVEPQGAWYRNFEYEEERKRGLDFHEDLYNPCALRFDLSTMRQAALSRRSIRGVPTWPPLTRWLSGNVAKSIVAEDR